MHKKSISVLAVLFVLTMVFSFIGCSGSKEPEETEVDVEHEVVGVWEAHYEYELDHGAGVEDYVGDSFTSVLELYRGGSGTLYEYDDDQGDQLIISMALSWEIVDGNIVNCVYSRTNAVVGYEYDSDSDTLTNVSRGYVFERTE